MKKKKNKDLINIVKRCRKIEREEEINQHGKLISNVNIQVSKKKYNRKKLKSPKEHEI